MTWLDPIPHRATRRAFAEHLGGVAMVLFLLLVIAYTIDLAGQFAPIRAAAAERDMPLLSLLLPYLGQRGVDILVRMLPTATFFGVFLVEIRRRARLESVILAAAGASPWRSHLALVWLGLLLGALLWAMEARLRPPAVWTQVESGLGGYAQRFPAGWNRDQWIIAGDTAIRADLNRSEAPYLRNVLLFEGLRADDLTAVLAADEARPEAPGQWRLTGVTSFALPDGTPSPAPDRILALPLLPSQLQYRGFVELLLPNDALRDLQSLSPRPDNAAWADVELLRRATMVLYPVLIALIAAGFVPLGHEGREPRLARLIALGALGYFYVTAMKVVGRLGALEVINPALSVLAPLAASALLALWLMRARL